MRTRVSSLLAVVDLTIVALAPGQSRAANLTTLVSFCSLANCTDGQLSFAGLIIDANGNLFGTTFASGAANDGGTAFEIIKTARGYASTATTLVSFCALPNCADGRGSYAGLIADANGNLFGTMHAGGSHGRGVVFEIAKTANGYASTSTTLVSFCALPNCADGAEPQSGLIADGNGNLFGNTLLGGANDAGTVFEIPKTPDGYASTPITLVSFNGTNGRNPFGGLIADANGNLFGTTVGGGAYNRGTVFEIAKTANGYASTPTVLVSFCALANCADGAQPSGGLIIDANGNLFGTTALGGAYNRGGTVFEIAKTAYGYASTPTVLHSFCALANCADGAQPSAGLIADANGNLFGTAGGGSDVPGTVFEIPKLVFGLFRRHERVHFPFGSRYGSEFLYCLGSAGT
jgi:uncharacterized repeat protein (TIGR03803 family)